MLAAWWLAKQVHYQSQPEGLCSDEQ